MLEAVHGTAISVTAATQARLIQYVFMTSLCQLTDMAMVEEEGNADRV
jgi:hypothetical protein